MSTIYLISTGASHTTLKLNSKEDLLKLTACSYQTKLEVIESLYVYPSKIAFERTKLRSDTEGGRVVTYLSFSKFNYDIFLPCTIIENTRNILNNLVFKFKYFLHLYLYIERFIS